MTPITFLVLFCGLMSVIAVSRVLKAELFAVDSERGHGEVGAALISVGVTFLATFWMALEEGMASWSLRGVVLGVGIALALSGILVLLTADR
ncbi:hypothetical protein OB919_19385 [Halobacteria archaeon AArc-curdl1]|uniref:Uncharacterized protein n=1 Tax=Natronosalvus hydrolyticus TaxID=2979988 RepID=A0AAP2ZBH9_9EURY|nr:hypothetical protein [Halobacteria archaeon AArc-curdl1]